MLLTSTCLSTARHLLPGAVGIAAKLRMEEIGAVLRHQIAVPRLLARSSARRSSGLNVEVVGGEPPAVPRWVVDFPVDPSTPHPQLASRTEAVESTATWRVATDLGAKRIRASALRPHRLLLPLRLHPLRLHPLRLHPLRLHPLRLLPLLPLRLHPLRRQQQQQNILIGLLDLLQIAKKTIDRIS